jgi:uncharacterized protein YigE (DUF2233 family)
MKSKIILFLIVTAFTAMAWMYLETDRASANQAPQQKIDSLQILIDRLSRLGQITGGEKQGSTTQGKASEELRKSTLKALWNFSWNIRGGREVWYRHVKYRLFVVNLDSEEVSTHLYKKGILRINLSEIGTLKQELEKEGTKPLMITNAGMFNKRYEPQGLYVEENENVYFPLDTLRNIPNANFYLKPNGIFYIDASGMPHIDSTEALQNASNHDLRKLKAATQSGPMLIINGRMHPAFIQNSVNRKIRNGVGLNSSNPKKIIFALTLDESNFYDFSLFFSEVFNCNNALYLDGAISQMYVNNLDSTDLGGPFGPMIAVTKKK